MASCGCMVLCLCMEKWEFMHKHMGYTREEMDAKLAAYRAATRELRQALEAAGKAPIASETGRCIESVVAEALAGAQINPEETAKETR